MNRFERRPVDAGEAKIEYLDGDFRILRPGAFVRCAVTGEPIPLDELRYWSVDRQEAYATPAASMKRESSVAAARPATAFERCAPPCPASASVLALTSVIGLAGRIECRRRSTID